MEKQTQENLKLLSLVPIDVQEKKRKTNRDMDGIISLPQQKTPTRRDFS